MSNRNRATLAAIRRDPPGSKYTKNALTAIALARTLLDCCNGKGHEKGLKRRQKKDGRKGRGESTPKMNSFCYARCSKPALNAVMRT